MIINLGTIKSQILKRSNKNNETALSFGAILKNERKKRNMTLEESADNICSISYLSKIENNKIAISERYYETFLKRYEIDDSKIKRPFCISDVVEPFLDFFLKAKMVSYDYVSDFENKIDHQSLLIMMLYYINNELNQRAYDCYSKLLLHIKAFDDYELALFLLCVSILFYRIGSFSDSFETNTLFQTASKKVNLLKKIYQLRAAFKMHKSVYISYEYLKTLNELNELGFYLVISQLKKEHLIMLVKYQSYKKTMSELEKLSDISDDEKGYIKGLSAFYNRDILLIERVLQKVKASNQAHLFLLIRIYDYLGRKLDLINTMKSYEYQIPNKNIKVYLDFVYQKNTLDSSDFIDFIRQLVFNSSFDIDDYEILMLIERESQKVLAKQFFYKDIYSLTQIVLPRRLNLLMLKDDN